MGEAAISAGAGVAVASWPMAGMSTVAGGLVLEALALARLAVRSAVAHAPRDVLLVGRVEEHGGRRREGRRRRLRDGPERPEQVGGHADAETRREGGRGGFIFSRLRALRARRK